MADYEPQADDLPTWAVDKLLTEVVRLFDKDGAALTLLHRLGYPDSQLPTFTGRSREAWTNVFLTFEQGILQAPYRTILELILDVYAANPILNQIASDCSSYGSVGGLEAAAKKLEELQNVDIPPAPGPLAAQISSIMPGPVISNLGRYEDFGPIVNGCRIVVSTRSRADIGNAERMLLDSALAPRIEWISEKSTAFRIAVRTINEAVRRLGEIDGFQGHIVSSTQPCYLYHDLTVTGPDQAPWIIGEVPCWEALRYLADQFIEEGYSTHYGQGKRLPEFVVDLVDTDGDTRLNPNESLHDAGVPDGAHLRISHRVAVPGPPRSISVGNGVKAESDEVPRRTVFLSYASEDRAQVRSLYHRLQAKGFTCWFDEESLLGGQDWDLEIRRAMRASRFVIVCLSRRSTTKSGYVQKEVREALDLADQQPEGRIYLIPVRLQECSIPDRLRRQHYVDLYSTDGYDKLLGSLSFVFRSDVAD